MYYAHAISSSRRLLRIYLPVEVFPLYPSLDTSIMVEAVWDTGADFTAISRRFADAADISFVDDAIVGGVGGQGQKATAGALALKMPSGLWYPDKRVVACELPPGVDMLIGMDIIIQGDMHISTADGQTLFSFIYPSLPNPINLAAMAASL
jgi:hypothetical protein